MRLCLANYLTILQLPDTLLIVQVEGRSDEVRSSFISIDADGSGLLSWRELGEALKSAGLRVTDH